MRSIRFTTSARFCLMFALLTFFLLGQDTSAKAASAIPHSVVNGECTVATPTISTLYVGTVNYYFEGWVGCDSKHSLNIEGSTDSLNWGTCGNYCTKRTLTEQSYVNNNSTGYGYEAGFAMLSWQGHLYISWIGTDAQINVGYYNWTTTVQNKTHWSDYSHFTPALTTLLHNGSYVLFLAFTGTDSRLNVRHSYDGITWVGFATVSNTSLAGPGFADWVDSPFGDQLYIAYMGTDTRVYMGYFDGTAVQIKNQKGLTICNPTCHATKTNRGVSLVYGRNGKMYLGFNLYETDSVEVAGTTDGSNFTYKPFNGYDPINSVSGVSGAFHYGTDNTTPYLWFSWMAYGLCTGGCASWKLGDLALF